MRKKTHKYIRNIRPITKLHVQMHLKKNKNKRNAIMQKIH